SEALHLFLLRADSEDFALVLRDEAFLVAAAEAAERAADEEYADGIACCCLTLLRFDLSQGSGRPDVLRRELFARHAGIGGGWHRNRRDRVRVFGARGKA